MLLFGEHGLRFNGEREAKYLRFIFGQYLRLNVGHPLYIFAKLPYSHLLLDYPPYLSICNSNVPLRSALGEEWFVGVHCSKRF